MGVERRETFRDGTHGEALHYHHMEPFISVVVPLLNEEPYVERLTRSLLDQDYSPGRYEIIMADGGSTDRTVEVLDKLNTDGHRER